MWNGFSTCLLQCKTNHLQLKWNSNHVGMRGATGMDHVGLINYTPSLSWSTIVLTLSCYCLKMRTSIVKSSDLAGAEGIHWDKNGFEWVSGLQSSSFHHTGWLVTTFFTKQTQCPRSRTLVLSTLQRTATNWNPLSWWSSFNCVTTLSFPLTPNPIPDLSRARIFTFPGVGSRCPCNLTAVEQPMPWVQKLLHVQW